MFRKATIVDYIEIQGGRPNISQDEGGIYHISHEYRKDRAEVTTHISPESRGTVRIGDVEFEVAKLWRFEGGPCEAESAKVSGEGYNRRK